MITREQKKTIVEAVNSQSVNYGSKNKQAVALGINAAQLSQLCNGKLDKVISEANWVSIAEKVGVSLKIGKEWKTAKTEAFQVISEQLSGCQKMSISAILCDLPDVGKRTPQRYMYAKTNMLSI